MKSVLVVMVFLGILSLLIYTFLEGGNTYVPRINLLRNSILKNILELNVRNDSIFFLETSSESFEHGVLEINKRAACALESAAVHHRNRSVYMVYVFPNATGKMAIRDRFLKPLLTYPNIRMAYAVSGDYVKGTPAEGLYSKGTIDASPYWMNHHSDVLRVVTLLKFGGIYLDGDVVVLRPLDELGRNFIGLEARESLGSAVMGFERVGFGRRILESVLRDVSENYRPDQWIANGPSMLTKWVKSLCNATSLEKFSNEKCSSLRILSPDHFYPIYYPAWGKFFDEKYNNEVFERTKNSYLVHLWNKLSSKRRLYLDSNASYLIWAKENCPKVYSQLYRTF